MQDKPIKVLRVVHWPISGIVRGVYNGISLLPKGEVETHVVFFYYDENTIMEFSKICKTVHCLNLSESFIKGLFKFYKIVRGISPDIIHAHSFQPMVWSCLFSASKTKKVNSIHNEYPYLRKNNIKCLIKRGLQIKFFVLFNVEVVAISRKIFEILLKFNFDHSKLSLIENGIPIVTKQFKPIMLNEARNEIGLRPDEKLIITLGRLDEQKAFNILLQAFREIQQKHKSLKLVIIGDGPEKVTLLNLTNEFGLNKQVIFLGFKDNPTLYLAIADIYVCSSDYEGLPLSVAEAMLYKLPIVATRVGAIPDMIEHGISGLIVEPNNPKAIANALHDLLSNSYDLESLGCEAKKTVIERYDIRRAVNSYLDLYKRIKRVDTHRF